MFARWWATVRAVLARAAAVMPSRRVRRDVAVVVLEGAGFAAMIVAVGMVWVPAAVFAGGGLLVAYGVGMERTAP